MNNEINKETLKNLYLANKDLLTPIICLGISLMLVLFFIIPQIQAVPEKKTTLDVETLKLNKLKQYEKLVMSSDQSVLESQLKTAVLALPSEKDFQGILSAFSLASANSGAQILEYSFKEGASTEGEAASKFPILNFSLTIQGSSEQITSFAKELYKSNPISEIIDFKYSPLSSNLTVLFYYKPLPQAQNEDRGSVKETSPKEQQTLNQISEWNAGQIDLNIPIPKSSTGSGETGGIIF